MMTSGIATIGYGDRAFDAEQYLHQILDVNTRALIVDTRTHPTCSWSSLWQHSSLAARFGKHYC